MNIADQQPEIIHNFRRCHMRGCLGMGNWSPTISLSPDGMQRAYLRMDHLLMCDHHKEYITIDDLVDKPLFDGTPAWERIQLSFTKAGKFAPLREFTNLIWDPA